MQHLIIVIGTRPEALKLAPVITEMRRKNLDNFLTIVDTGQQSRLIRESLATFGLKADKKLQPLKPGEQPDELFGHLVAQLSGFLTSYQDDEIKPILIALGDTLTAHATAQSAYLNGLSFYHIEAGLRKNIPEFPTSEEFSRQVATHYATHHFAPTVVAKQNLLNEGIPEHQISVTGNTIIDALKMVFVNYRISPGKLHLHQRKLVLITCNRAESQPQKLRSIFQAIRNLAISYPDLQFKWVGHMSPGSIPFQRVKDHVPNLELVQPLPYPEMVQSMASARMVITDSGGIQDEAPSFGIPVILLRDATNRPESVQAGYSFPVGLNADRMTRRFKKLMESPMEINRNPYGDGMAAIRIVAALTGKLEWQSVYLESA